MHNELEAALNRSARLFHLSGVIFFTAYTFSFK